MFCLRFYVDETYDEPGWSYEFVTDDFGEAIDDLFYARNYAAEGESRWEGAQLMVLVLRNGKINWEQLTEESWVE